MRAEEILEIITGNVPEGQRKDRLARIKSDPLLLKEYHALKNAWSLSSHLAQVPEAKIRTAYLAQLAKIRSPKTIPLKRRLYPFLKYAVVLLIVFGTGVLFHKYFPYHAVPDTGLTEFVVPRGQMAEVNLPDGSHVWINSATRLSFTRTFDGEKREVTLTGEAYFDVRKDKKPFVVTTKFGNITVLGTSFNVQAYDDAGFQTTLVEGSVRYTNNRKETVKLSPGQQLYLSGDDHILVRGVKTDEYTLWKDGLILFKKEPLKEVIKKLERHFDVKITLDDSSLETIRFTGSIGNESLEDVVELINKTKPISYAYDKKAKQINIRQRR